MKDRAMLWLTAGGIAFWLLASYPPSRAAAIHLARSIANEIASKF